MYELVKVRLNYSYMKELWKIVLNNHHTTIMVQNNHVVDTLADFDFLRGKHIDDAKNCIWQKGGICYKKFNTLIS